MKTFSLRTKMALGGISILLVPLFIIAAVTFANSIRTLEEVSKGQAMQLAQSLSGTIQIALEKDAQILTAIANDPLVFDKVSKKEFDGLDEKLADLYVKLGVDYEGLSIIDAHGIVRSDGADRRRRGISVAEREYIHLGRQGKTGIGPLNASKATGAPVFGICAPIMSRENQFLGGVLGVVKADFFVRYVSSLKLGRTGYAFMLDRQGMIIAHPNTDFILNLDTTRRDDLAEIAARMIRQESGTGEYIYQGIKKIAGFAPVAMTGWSVGVTQNREEIMALAYANRNLIMLVSGVFLILTVLAIYLLSGTLSAPVQKTLATLNQAIDQAAEAIVIIGLDRKVQFVNPATGSLFDRPVQEFLGRKLPLENTNLADNSEDIWKILEQGKWWRGCMNGIKRDSSRFSMELTVTPVRDETGRIGCFLAIGKDITRELAMEAQLRQSQKMEAIGTLAGGIAHDFNNILSAVFGYAELSLNSLEDRKKTEHYIHEILNAAGRARELINRIMTFSRQAEHQTQPLKPKYMIREAIKLLRASLPATIEIRDRVTSDASIMADPVQIHQIMMNLCTNAGHAMKREGGTLEIHLDDIEVEEAFAQQHQGLKPGRYVNWKVSDSGEGISSQIVDRIFDPFFTTKPQGEGTGLGLSVVHGIVKALGGIVNVISQIGKGATFSIYLPVIDAIDNETEGQDTDAIPGGSERLLLVDDEASIVRTVAQMLEDLGYRVSGFTQSTSALGKFLNDPSAFDAVITDCTMPRMTGYALAEKIREIRADIPIIMCSGHLDKDAELKMHHAGINAFLRKPCSMRLLATTVRRTIDGSAVK